jgi:hypothetical protein
LAVLLCDLLYVLETEIFAKYIKYLDFFFFDRGGAAPPPPFCLYFLEYGMLVANCMFLFTPVTGLIVSNYIFG